MLNPNGRVSKFLKYPSFFLGKNYKDLGVGQDLIEFAKILMLESLNFFYIFSLKKEKKRKENVF
jgi:hypothetical protein